MSVADIVKRYAAGAKLDASVFSGHWLRAGFVTSALEDGADVLKVMDVTRRKNVQTLKDWLALWPTQPGPPPSPVPCGPIANAMC